jgi:hypothetical protein
VSEELQRAIERVEDAGYDVLPQGLRLELTADELALLSGIALYGLHCAGVTYGGVIANIHKYTERVRRSMEPDSAAFHVRLSLSTKLRDLLSMSPKPEVFTA